MKRKSGKKHTGRTYLLFALLALLCVGIAELAACRFFAPALYQQITSPVRRCLQSVAELGVHTAAEVSAWWSAYTAQEELSDPQLAGEPAIPSDTPISDPSLTELKEIDSKEVLTGGIIPVVYYNQGGAAWADQPYGDDDIGHYGCGPVTMSMAVSSMGGWDSDPVQMAQWSAEHGYWAKGGGSYLSIIEGTATAYGLTASSLVERTPQAVRETLLSGNLLVALMGPGHFTQGGHFILLRGVTLSGMILVADPNSEERSLMEWDPQLILDELSASTASGAPLWVLSPADS